MAEVSDLFSKDYLQRARAFIELMWDKKREELLPVLRSLIFSAEDVEWRLRALDVLATWQAKEEITFLEGLYLDADPLMVRGWMWFISKVGEPQDIFKMLEFAVSPKGRIIRPETVIDLLVLAIQNQKISAAAIRRHVAGKSQLERYLAEAELDDDKPRLLTVYPSADYLALRCREQEIPFKAFKRIHYRDYKPNNLSKVDWK